MFERRRREGLRSEPMRGWPLDRLLVGVGTLRTLRELCYRDADAGPAGLRAWDLALWSGVTPQGSTKSMCRLEREGLVEERPPARPGRAVGYRIERTNPLVTPLTRLFADERRICRHELLDFSERAARARRARLRPGPSVVPVR